MKKIQSILLITAGIAFLYSCELLDTGTSSSPTASDIEGVWKCNENSETFKATEDFYTVYIEPLATDSFKVYITNFYQLGNDVDALAIISGYSLTIGSQTLKGGYTVRGSGTIASNKKSIELSYQVNDGSGVWDDVSATYTFQY